MQPGPYQLIVTFTAGVSAVAGVSGTVPFATTTHLLQVLPPVQPGLLIVDPVPLGTAVSIDGVSQPLLTPCAVPTTPGPHFVQLIQAGSAPFEVTVDTSAAPVTLIGPTLAPVATVPVVLAPLPVNLDFGVLKAGVGVTGQLMVQMNGSALVQGVVATSANWIRGQPAHL